MKKIFSLVLSLALLASCTACGHSPTESGSSVPVSSTEESSPNSSEGPSSTPETIESGSKLLVAYFSCTGNTKAVAEKIAELTGADLYEIVLETPYTAEDLDYHNDECRANQEMNDESARPAIGSEAIDLSSYETIFIGYPIWWGTMPKIINTFLDDYDFSGKTILPFCTSGSSGISESVSAIRAEEPDAAVDDGLRATGAEDSGITDWLENSSVLETQ